MTKYRDDFTTLINQETQIPGNGCNAITIENTGTSTIKIFGKTLLPGDQYVSNYNEGEENHTTYILQYVTPGIDQVTVIRKIKA